MSTDSIENIIELIKSSCKDIYYLLRNYNYTIRDKDLAIKLDIECNNIFCKHLNKSDDILYIISEEMVDKLIINNEGKYVISIDPLDGSKNIESNLSVGSIFCIYKYNASSGRDVVASGYCLYTYSCIMVYSKGYKSNYICNLTNNVEKKISKNSSKYKYYCINERFKEFNDEITNIITRSKSDDMIHRWTGCMVSDIHRIINHNGWFCYPENKLRLLYECIPISYILENLGGKSLNIDKYPVLDIPINLNNIHCKSSIFCIL